MASFVVRAHRLPDREPRFTFQLLDDQNRLLLSSETYETAGNARRGVAAVRRLAPNAQVVSEEPELVDG